MNTFADYGIDTEGKTGEFDVMCPKCGGMNRTKRVNQREKTLSVNTDKGTWQCHHTGCEWKGGLGMNPYATETKTYNPPTPLMTALSNQDKLYKWFEARGISREVVDRNRVTTHTTDKGTAIAFLHYRDGKHVHTAFRALSGKKIMWQDSGTERIFWGLDDINEHDTHVLICEGHPDKLAWNMAIDIPVLSIPDGAGTGDTKLSYLSSAAKIIDRMDHVYLAMDGDDAGQEMMHELARRIGVGKCVIVKYPEGCKDANDVLISAGQDALRDCWVTSKSYPVEGIYEIDDLWDDMEEYVAFGADQGVDSGLPGLDKLFRPRVGTVTVVGGISGHGKSEVIDQLVTRYAKRHGWACALFSPENFPAHEHAVEIAEILLQKPHEKFASGEMDLVKDFIRDHYSFIYPADFTIDDILERMRVSVLRKNVRACVLDPYNMIEHKRPKDMSETEYVSMIMTKLSRFATQHQVAVFFLVHPAKYDNYTGKDKEPRPGLNDLAGSGNFRNKCDYGLIVYRDIYDERVPAQIVVQKVRHKATGKTGIWYFTLNNETRNIEEAPNPNQLTVLARKTNA